MSLDFRCPYCDSIYRYDTILNLKVNCAKCGKRAIHFQVEYLSSYKDSPIEARTSVVARSSIQRRERNIWRYAEFLPGTVGLDRNPVPMTPLVKSRGLASCLGLKNLYFKDETGNPTGSFKDRQGAIAAQEAFRCGIKGVVTASSGNMAIALARACSLYGIESYGFVPAFTPSDKTVLANVFGSKIFRVKGNVDESRALLEDVYEQLGWLPTNTLLRPFLLEGCKTLGFEICEQLGWHAPDKIIMPVGSGLSLNGLNKGIREFHNIGLLENKGNKCAMIAAEPEQCAPFTRAIEAGANTIEPIGEAYSIAGGLVVKSPPEGDVVLRAIRSSGGTAIAVSDEEILDAERCLARMEGIFAEPSAAAAVAVLMKMSREKRLGEREEIVCVVTGSGMHDMESAAKISEGSPIIEPSVDAIKGALGI